MVLLAIDLHLVRLGMISIMPPARHQGPWHYHHGRPSPLQYISWIYIQHAGLKKEKHNHMAPAGCLQQISFHTTIL